MGGPVGDGPAGGDPADARRGGPARRGAGLGPGPGQPSGPRPGPGESPDVAAGRAPPAPWPNRSGAEEGPGGQVQLQLLDLERRSGGPRARGPGHRGRGGAAGPGGRQHAGRRPAAADRRRPGRRLVRAGGGARGSRWRRWCGWATGRRARGPRPSPGVGLAGRPGAGGRPRRPGGRTDGDRGPRRRGPPCSRTATARWSSTRRPTRRATWRPTPSSCSGSPGMEEDARSLEVAGGVRRRGRRRPDLVAGLVRPARPWADRYGSTGLPVEPGMGHSDYYAPERPTLAAIGEVVAGAREPA